MKRLLIALMLLTSPAQAAISVVHHNAVQGNAASPTLAFATNPTAGNFLGIMVTWGNGLSSHVIINSVTSSIGGDTVQCRAEYADTTVAGTSGRVCYVENTVGGACTITVNLSSAVDYGIQLVEVSGLPTSGSFDVDIPGASSSATTLTSGTYSTATASEIALVITGDISNCQTYTQGTGFTLLDTSTCTNLGQGAEYQIYSSTQTSVTAVITYNNSSTTGIIRGAVFKATGGSTTPANQFPRVIS